MFKNVLSFFDEKQLPWFISHRLQLIKNSFYYYKNRLFHAFLNCEKGENLTITYICGFHGETGGSAAAASIANILAKKYKVEFVSFVTSDINHLLDSAVKVIKKTDFTSDLYICDAECEHTLYEQINRLNKKLLISCHCLPNDLHGLTEEYILKSLSYADMIHFVSDVQKEAFQLNAQKVKVIPNTSQPVHKNKLTYNVGSVGNLSDLRKNAKQSIEIALASDADTIQLWSVKKDLWQNPKVVTHAWETDKQKIYNSFDVLVFMSELETFGLVVIEAMSAGIPCMLSGIPVFKQFKDCPGVVIIDEANKDNAAELLNQLLKDKSHLAEKMKEYFESHYSSNAIFKQWDDLVCQVIMH